MDEAFCNGHGPSSWRNPVRWPSMSLALSFCNRSASTFAINFSEQFLRRIGRKSLDRNRFCLLGTRPIDLLLVYKSSTSPWRKEYQSLAQQLPSDPRTLLCFARSESESEAAVRCGHVVWQFLHFYCKLPKTILFFCFVFEVHYLFRSIVPSTTWRGQASNRTSPDC
jgi:hypothetical protein